MCRFKPSCTLLIKILLIVFFPILQFKFGCLGQDQLQNTNSKVTNLKKEKISYERSAINCFILKPIANNTEYTWGEWGDKISFKDTSIYKYIYHKADRHNFTKDTFMTYVMSFEMQKRININYDCLSKLTTPIV